jgi:hypothetical protein
MGPERVFIGGERLGFHRLVIHRDAGRPPLLGCPRVRTFFEVEEDTLLAVGLLQDGCTIAEAARQMEARAGEECDVLGLARDLDARGFVASVDGVPPWDGEPEREPAPRHFALRHFFGKSLRGAMRARRSALEEAM